jgi:uncharacterized protein (TIGR02996 family)
MAWRIEQAKTDRSSCRFCNKQIAKGEYRFGNDDLNAFWYHLACAPEGKPRAFKPFAKQAAKLAPAKKPAKPKPQAAGARNAELEAKLVAEPTKAARGVFADWLQSQGDPWGEVIALELAGKAAAAKQLIKQHSDALTGGYAGRGLEWRHGFIDVIRLEGSLKGAKAALPALLGLRTTLLLRELVLPMAPDAELIRIVNAQAPRTLERLFVWTAPAIVDLAIPSLADLTLWLRTNVPVDAAAIAPLFASTKLPKLRRLGFYNAPVPVPLLQALADSPLLAKLRRLDFIQNALSPEGEKLVLSRKRDFDHLQLDFGRQATVALQRAFGA